MKSRVMDLLKVIFIGVSIKKEELMMENSVRVLLVEDEEKMRELIKIAFKKENFERLIESIEMS